MSAATKLRFSERSKLGKIERTLHHAQLTRRTETDSWLNAYQDDVAWLVSKLKEYTDA